ncbi:MAG: protein-glutamate O-methyltransferase CheR [Oscillospiraceae bacterium]
MINITQPEFKKMVDFVESNYGVNLINKKHLIEGRLQSTLAEKGCKTYTEYIDLLMKKNPQDIDNMISKLTTNYTFFMREHAHFDYFKDVILPQMEKQYAAKRSIAVWSAGCSTGEEPYTLAILLHEYFGAKADKWDIRVLATDISPRVLNIAMLGEYPEESLKEVPETWKTRYFVKSPGGYTVAPKIKNSVIFKSFNLMDKITFKTKFDVIFCRNVMIYFDAPVKDALVERYYDATNPGGYLLIGHSETLNKATTRYNYLMPATYKK